MLIIFILFALTTTAMVVSAIMLGSKSVPSKDMDYVGTMILNLVFVLALVLTFIKMTKLELVTPTIIVGLSIFCFGSVLRIVALKNLKRMYSAGIRLQPHHILVTEGIYRIIRHPLNLGLIIVMAGLTLINPTFITFICLVICLCVELRRNKIEDNMLVVHLGDIALEYQSRVPSMNIIRRLL